MVRLKPLWNPVVNGLSVSALELWLVDRIAFEVSYLRDMEAIEPWNKNMMYGTLVGAGIEGFIKTRQVRGAAKFIDNECQKQLSKFAEYDDITWWAGLAQLQVKTFVDLYGKDFDLYGITEAETKNKIEVILPSGRTITLNGYTDGEGSDIIFEHKCRGEWDEQHVAREIDFNLQVNVYTLMFLTKHGRLPERIWYQHSRRPGGFGYSGPRKKAKESDTKYRNRIAEAIDTDRGYHFFRYWIRPDEERFQRFLHGCLYPMLEAFLDWYTYMTHPQRKDEVNKVHWPTPYGLYNPFMEGTLERFRNFRLTGSTIGLRPKVSYR